MLVKDLGLSKQDCNGSGYSSYLYVAPITSAEDMIFSGAQWLNGNQGQVKLTVSWICLTSSHYNFTGYVPLYLRLHLILQHSSPRSDQQLRQLWYHQLCLTTRSPARAPLVGSGPSEWIFLPSHVEIPVICLFVVLYYFEVDSKCLLSVAGSWYDRMNLVIMFVCLNFHR